MLSFYENFIEIALEMWKLFSSVDKWIEWCFNAFV